MRLCRICKIEKDESEFHNGRKPEHRCKECKKILHRERYQSQWFRMYCLVKKSDCKRKNIVFELTPEYLENIWTGVCPIFGVEVERASAGRGSHHSAHLDRINPDGGYVEGNVAWISGRANRIKYDATIQELRKIADWMERVTTNRDECNGVGGKQMAFEMESTQSE